MKNFIFVKLLILLIIPSFLKADVSVPTNSTGSESTTAGTASDVGSWANSGGFKISWNVTQTTGGFNYIYTLTNATGGALTGANLFILQMATNITPLNYTTNITSPNQTILNGGPQTYTGLIPGSIQSIYGIEFNIANTPTISFFSDRAPVYGDFAASNALGTTYAYNNGIAATPLSSSMSYATWVPTPGSTNIQIPEPSTYLILASSLAFVYFAKKRRIIIMNRG